MRYKSVFSQSASVLLFPYYKTIFNVSLAAFSGGEVGLAITQVMSLTGMIQWAMRQNAEMENQMMAVERVLEYTQIVPEPNLRDRGKFAKKTEKKIALPANAPKNWPSEGVIQFRSVYLKYAEDDPPVLKELNIAINPGEKVRGFFVQLRKQETVCRDQFKKI